VSSQEDSSGLTASGLSDFGVPRKHGTPPCDFYGEDFEDGEDAYRLAKGKVHYSVPSFVPETASIFFHEECWKKAALERKKGRGQATTPETKP
jgi:hypothetical protein